MLVRPTVIAILYNARNRGTNAIHGIADWRVLVCLFLIIYSNVQVGFALLFQG
jgi:hypothetical protein